jgi:hypothetical protein
MAGWRGLQVLTSVLPSPSPSAAFGVFSLPVREGGSGAAAEGEGEWEGTNHILLTRAVLCV